MSESVTLPALGESVTEGTVTRWLKQVGERVEVDEPLLEVSTDKVDTEIPSPVAGVVEEILVAEDETVEVGAVLARIGDGSSAGAGSPAPAAAAPASAESAVAAAAPPAAATPPVEPPVPIEPAAEQPATTEAATASPFAPPVSQFAPAPAAAAPSQSAFAPPAVVATEPAPASSSAEPSPFAPAPVPTAAAPAPAVEPAAEAAATSAPSSETPADGAHAGYLTPIVRKLANEKGVDLAALSGTGVGGRIRKQDVLEAAEARAQEAPVAAESAPVAAEPSTAASNPTSVALSPLRGTTVPMSRLRKVVAERAVVSLQTSAQLTTVVEADVTKLASFRDSVKSEFQQKTGTKLSFLPFFTLAAAEALRTFPIINATVDGDNIVYPDHEHISIAVDSERGLLTPVVRDAAELSVAQLAGQIADLAERTRDNKLKPDELAGGTFTVTNTGSRGALFDTPLVFLPQVAILGTGVVTKKAAVVSGDGGDAIAVRSTVYLALSYDHRIVDGADAARFLTTVKARLEAADFAAVLGI